MLPQGFEVKAYNVDGRLLHTLRSRTVEQEEISSVNLPKFDRLESLFNGRDYKGKPGRYVKSDPRNYVYVNMLVTGGSNAIKSIVMSQGSDPSEIFRMDDLSIGSSG